jgi:hypothetical protein
MWRMGSIQQLRRLLQWNLVRTLDQLQELPQIRTERDQCLAIHRMDAKNTEQLDKALGDVHSANDGCCGGRGGKGG